METNTLRIRHLYQATREPDRKCDDGLCLLRQNAIYDRFL